MAAPKYLKRDATSGRLTEVAATETGPSAEVVVSTGAGGTIDPSLLPASGAATATAGENIAAGAFVYIKASDGKLYNATWVSGGHPAIGYCNSSFSSAATATYYAEGSQNTGLTGLTAGDYYYGDPGTPGGVVTTPPAGGSAYIQQRVGMAVSTTAIEVMFGEEIQTV